MKSALLVFLGGGLGSVLRYQLGKLLNNAVVTSIPYGTLTANTLGSLLLGFLFGLALKYGNFSPAFTMFFAVGFCGGFTTFSTFAYENQVFLRSGDYYNFLIYSLGSLFLGITAVFLGLLLSRLT
ncbi:fluoride efflux transporter CrcB [Autumnicola edwardsiae]|jgi:CrcB protein|uniref:Fluoride-specific ion channel FluC n=1 Tax=Autumnicola edwardsiae TaxID=3075594 RepID=A0ABU3CWR5_9FLAO|nr:fluoride efflux transporter CrcB [Zunongwangia sp. F297]MDT0650711.1 fluoride efflux transporter CrcB [Zunongwangia sp. F297]